MPPKFQSGEYLSAAKLNEVVNMIIQRVVAGRGIIVKSFGSQIVIEAKEEFRPLLPPLHQMVVKSDEGDYLKCRRLDALEDEGTQDIYVWKPWTLRKTPFNNKTVNGISYVYSENWARVASKDSDEEDQLITPDYWVNCVIFVAKMNISVEVANDIFCQWIDANVDGRAWAAFTEEEEESGGGPQE